MFASRKYDRYDDDTLQYIDRNLGSILRDDVLQKVNTRMRSDKAIILSLPNTTVNCSLDFDKRNSVARYIHNLILLTGIEFIQTQPAPRVEGITDYIRPTKNLGAADDANVDMIVAKIDTHSALLKTVPDAAIRVLLKDYIISLHTNGMSNMIPNFLTSYGMVTCKSIKNDVFEYNKLCDKFDNPALTSCVGNTNDTGSCSMRVFTISDGVNCGIGAEQTLTMRDFITANPGISRADLCALITQVLIGIHFAQQRFQLQHNKLITKNILIHKIPTKKLNYKIALADVPDVVFSTDKIAVINNFTAGVIYQGILDGWIGDGWRNVAGAVANSTIEAAYWANDAPEMIRLLRLHQNIVGMGLELIADSSLPDYVSVERLSLRHLRDVAQSVGEVVRERPVAPVYSATSDIRAFITDLFTYVGTLTNGDAQALVTRLNTQRLVYPSILACIADIRAHLVAGDHQEVRYGLHPVLGPVTPPVLIGGTATLGHIDEESSDKELEHKIKKYAFKLSELMAKNANKINQSTKGKKIRQRGGVDIDAVIRGTVDALPFIRDPGYGASGLPGGAAFNFDMLELRQTYQENDVEAFFKTVDCKVRGTDAPRKMYFGNPGDTVFFSYDGNQIMYDNVTPDKLPKDAVTPYTYNFAIVKDKHSGKMKIRFGRIFNGTEIGGRHIHLMRNDPVYITGEIKIQWHEGTRRWKIFINMNSSKTGYTQPNGFFRVANVVDPTQAQKNLYMKWLFGRLRAIFTALVPADTYTVEFDPLINMDGNFLAATRNLGGVHEYYENNPGDNNYCPSDDFVTRYNRWGRDNNVSLACMDYIANGVYANKAIDWSNTRCAWKLLPQVPQV